MRHCTSPEVASQVTTSGSRWRSSPARWLPSARPERVTLPAARARFFNSPEEAGKFLEDFFAAGDLLLVKGSRGVQMERIVDALIARHAAPGEISREEVRH